MELFFCFVKKNPPSKHFVYRYLDRYQEESNVSDCMLYSKRQMKID